MLAVAFLVFFNEGADEISLVSDSVVGCFASSDRRGASHLIAGLRWLYFADEVRGVDYGHIRTVDGRKRRLIPVLDHSAGL